MVNLQTIGNNKFKVSADLGKKQILRSEHCWPKHHPKWFFFFSCPVNRPFSISQGLSWECHCVSWTLLCSYIRLFFFSLHICLSSDWLSWCADRFSGLSWIPLILMSPKSCHVCRHTTPISHYGGVNWWGDSYGTGRLPSNWSLWDKRGILRSLWPSLL